MKIFFGLVLVIICVISCEIINPEEEIPVYIKVDKATLSCDDGTQGANTSKIVDIWVNVDGNRQGTYEMPVTFPVLSEGSHKLTLRAGIKVNGIAADRSIYPFFDFYETDVVFNPDSIYEYLPVFHYTGTTIFRWLENFEDAGITLKRNSVSDTNLTIQPYPDTPENSYGYFAIDDTKPLFFYESSDSFPCPGSDLFLELDYKNNDYLVVGLKIIKTQYSVYDQLITLNPSAGMNKIYIDLGSYLNLQPDAMFYSVYFYAYKQSGISKAEYCIDNIKLLHF